VIFFLVPIMLVFGSAAYAQECPQCAAADVCIKDFTRAVAAIRSDYRKGVADQRKGREQSLRDRFSPRSAVTDRDNLEQAVRSEIEHLKDCLGKTL